MSSHHLKAPGSGHLGDGFTSWGKGGTACPADYASRTLPHTHSAIPQSYHQYLREYLVTLRAWLRQEMTPDKRMQVRSLDPEDPDCMGEEDDSGLLWE
jgi:hypothetical protein